MHVRRRSRAVNAFAALLLQWALTYRIPAIANAESLSEKATKSGSVDREGRLGVVVPAYEGDLERALESVARWPTACSSVTQESADLILYKAEADKGSASKIAEVLERSAGRCFANTRVVFANLDDEDNVYPKGPSVMFYKMFLDPRVRSELEEYDALSIIEWDVMVASDTSFEGLYNAAFGGPEPFWMKGSVLAGSNFHHTAEATNSWHVLGHINGNAIYNNKDPAWFEYVDYTRARWQYDYPYDVALWATIADFPYSWPLWQRFSSKFVSTNLIANVGYENVDATAVSNAVAGETLFVHGTSVEGGTLSLSPQRRKLADDQADVSCQASCGEATGSIDGMSTVCDPTCDKEARFDGYLCGAGDSSAFGSSCRACYTDQQAALRAEASLRINAVEGEAKHVIMCDTLNPPPATECSAKCADKDDTVCDATCGTGRHGDYNCNWRGYGKTCRYCFHDPNAALIADEVAKHRGGRVIMCATHEPPQPPAVAVTTLKKSRFASGSLPISRTSIMSRKLSTDVDDGVDDCLDSCPNLGNIRGRVCDATCSDANPIYGTRGCNVRDGRWGSNCRRCFVDLEVAYERDKISSRVIMCDTLAPPEFEDETCTHLCEYTGSRRGRVCDDTCSDVDPIYGTRGCGYNDNAYGVNCRRCFADEDLARERDSPTSHVIMCDTLAPPTVEDETCSHTCERTGDTTGRRCDERCSDAVPIYGGRGCGILDNLYGVNCRRCFTDEDLARASDKPVRRAIMCDTLAPVDVYYQGERRRLATMPKPELFAARSLQIDTDDGGVDDCLDSCPITGRNRGRVCDATCADADPIYGTRGCNVRDGRWGSNCRRCFVDIELAYARDKPSSRVIMCDTLAPPVSEDETCSHLCPNEGMNTGRVCDDTCSDDDPIYGTRGCGTQDERFGVNCRRCFLNEDAARDVDSPDNRVIMCDTLAPLEVEDETCTYMCERTGDTTGRRCDERCSDAVPIYGGRGCGILDNLYGVNCRRCFTDEDLARASDKPVRRAIMCDTLAPVDVYYQGERRRLATMPKPELFAARSLQIDTDDGGVDDCLDSCPITGRNRGRVCDATCADADPIYGTRGCNVRDGRWGSNCRRCFVDIELAYARDKPSSRVIMCDTLAPPVSEDETCSHLCPNEGMNTGRVCDDTCSDDDPIYGTRGCGTQDERFGVNCRRCFLNEDAARDVDSPDNRVIMCDTLAPLEVEDETCTYMCERTGDTTGRRCDERCSDAVPIYGGRGCGILDNLYGVNCRRCFTDEDLARASDKPVRRAIMCDTLAPVDVYYQGERRQLNAVPALPKLIRSVMLPETPSEDADIPVVEPVDEDSSLPFFGDLVRDNLCAFLSSSADTIGEAEATVRSVITFMPGMSVAVAVSPNDYNRFHGILGDLPGVAVVTSSTPTTSALNADKHCGERARLIYYLEPGTLVSRSFTSKDTHSPKGDLLVVHTETHMADYASRASAHAASAIVGFNAPLFTFGTDLILPSDVNEALRELVLNDSPRGADARNDYDRAAALLSEVDHARAPETLAALAYARNPEGVWFLNPQQWVSQHLFQAASIWDIPLVKPRFSCSPASRSGMSETEFTRALFYQLEAFSNGATCESGFIVYDSHERS